MDVIPCEKYGEIKTEDMIRLTALAFPRLEQQKMLDINWPISVLMQQPWGSLTLTANCFEDREPI